MGVRRGFGRAAEERIGVRAFVAGCFGAACRGGRTVVGRAARGAVAGRSAKAGAFVLVVVV